MNKDELRGLKDLYLKAIDCIDPDVRELDWEYIPRSQRPYWLICKLLEVLHDFLA